MATTPDCSTAVECAADTRLLRDGWRCGTITLPRRSSAAWASKRAGRWQAWPCPIVIGILAARMGAA